MPTEFDIRMKRYEKIETGRVFMPLLPVCARIDGRCFHSFTKGLGRPYDENLVNLMRATTKYLVEETNANIGYTQSDEISLGWYSNAYNSEIFFNGKIHKMVSLLASMTTAFFNDKLPEYLPDKAGKLACFDARVWQLPTLEEGSNVFLWRELDATRNSITMAAQCHYSHKQLHKVTTKQMQELLFKKGINWNDYEDKYKRGSYVQKRKVMRQFTTEEIDKLPAKHEARVNPDLEIVRSTVVFLELPPLSRVTNRTGVLFRGEHPLIGE